MRRALLLASCLALGACQPTTPPAQSGPSTPRSEKSSTPHEALLPIQKFEMFCFRPQGNYKAIVAAAGAMKLKPLPKALEPLMAPQDGQGRSFVVKVEKKKDRVERAILLGLAEKNICSVVTYGYGAPVVAEEAKQTYKLRSVMRDDVGLQVNEIFIPDGTSNRISEAHEKGLVAILRGKPGSGIGDVVTLSYISPEAAQQAFP